MLRNLILSAAAAGLAAALLAAALQQVTTTPLILEAERYEATGGGAHHHAEAVTGADDAAAAWTPADGLERTLHTSLATIVLGVGFSLALLGAMVLTDSRVDSRRGLAFGVAGFAACALAPALGLPPEIPGSAGADLAERQLWWMLAATATSLGLAGLLLGRAPALRLGGAVLILLPHLIGAPRPDAYASTAPAELAARFAATSLVVAAVFWAALGLASGAVYARLSRAA